MSYLDDDLVRLLDAAYQTAQRQLNRWMFPPFIFEKDHINKNSTENKIRLNIPHRSQLVVVPCRTALAATAMRSSFCFIKKHHLRILCRTFSPPLLPTLYLHIPLGNLKKK